MEDNETCAGCACDVPSVPEPTRFAFVYDGLLVAGDLTKWAKLWEMDQYAGDCPPPVDVTIWGGDPAVPPTLHRIEVTRGTTDEDGRVPHRIALPGFHDVVTVSVY